MDEVVAMFVTLMTAMILVACLLFAWIRTQGAAKANRGTLDAIRQVELLSDENAGLKGQACRLEERIAVLERIATDPADRTARAIEQLR